MNIIEILANKHNYGSKRNTRVIKYIVIHYTANDGDTAKANGNYFRDNVLEEPASAHYFVDDTCVVRSVPDNYVAYSVGGDKYPDCADTGGGTMHGIIFNNNSISVELCDTVRNNKSDFTERTLSNAIELVKSLMKKYNIDKNHIYRHFDVTGKICPLPMVKDLNMWKSFLDRLGDEEAMTAVEKQEFNNLKDTVDLLMNSLNVVGNRVTKLENPMIYNYIDENMPTWARPTIEKLVSSGKLKGSGDGLGLTEEMLRMLVILDRQGIFG